jgi:hypothetical protein
MAGKNLDLLEGAPAIAEYVYGNKDRARSIYPPKIRKKLGLFLLNGQLCGRRQTIEQRIAAEEAAASEET